MLLCNGEPGKKKPGAGVGGGRKQPETPASKAPMSFYTPGIALPAWYRQLPTACAALRPPGPAMLLHTPCTASRPPESLWEAGATSRDASKQETVSFPWLGWLGSAGILGTPGDEVAP